VTPLGHAMIQSLAAEMFLSEEKLIILYSVIRCDLQGSYMLRACGKRPFGVSSIPRAAATKLVGSRVSE